MNGNRCAKPGSRPRMSRHSHPHAASRSARSARPRLRHDHLARDAVGHVEYEGQHVLLLQRELPRAVPRRPRRVPRPSAPAAPRRRPTWSASTPAPWIRRCGRRVPAPVRNAGWRSSRSTSRRSRRPSGPARCTRRSCATRPGSCPICGMALEPRTVTLEDDESRARRHDAPVPVVARR